MWILVVNGVFGNVRLKVHDHFLCPVYKQSREYNHMKDMVLITAIQQYPAIDTAPYTRPHFHSIRSYTRRNLIMIGPYFCGRYYGRNTVRKVTVNGRIRTASFDLGNIRFHRVVHNVDQMHKEQTDRQTFFFIHI
jgi:hypothetical protein